MPDNDMKIGEAFKVSGLTVFVGFLAIAGFSILLIPAALLQAWVAVKIWGWFIVPFFHVSALTIPIALGFKMMLVILYPKHHQEEKNTRTLSERLGKLIGTSYCGPLAILLIAYVAHLYT